MSMQGWRQRIPPRWKLAARRTVARARGRRPAILMYHRVAHEPFDPWGLAVEPRRFAEQMEWLAHNRTVIPLHEFASLHRAGRLPNDAASVTLDDGYACALNAAAPVLESLGLSTTIFLPAELIRRRKAFWWDELAAIVIDSRDDGIVLDGEEFAVPAPRSDDRLWPAGEGARTGRQKLFYLLWSRLRRKAPGEIEKSLAPLRNTPSAASNSTRLLAPEEIRTSSSTAIQFGSHALLHASLPSLPLDERSREIGESMRLCETLTGAKPRTFAYPFGDVDSATMRLVEQAGYSCACATGDTVVVKRSSVFALPRVYAGNWDAADLRDMLGG